MFGLTDSQVVILFFVGQILLFCLLSCIMLIISAWRTEVKLQAMLESTHTIEYRDPDQIYPDELHLGRDESGDVFQKTPEENESDEEKFPSTITELNKKLEEGDIIIVHI